MTHLHADRWRRALGLALMLALAVAFASGFVFGRASAARPQPARGVSSYQTTPVPAATEGSDPNRPTMEPPQLVVVPLPPEYNGRQVAAVIGAALVLAGGYWWFQRRSRDE